MEKRPLVSIVIVNFNTKKLLSECIVSIEKNVKAPYEIIVVDNASSDKSVEELKKYKKNVRVIENKENLGFAKANNQGIKIAKGEYILLLNSDTYLTEDCIGPCIDKLRQNSQIGIISCKLLNPDGSVQPNGGYFPTLFKLFGWMSFLDDLPLLNSFLKSFHPKSNFYSQDLKLDWVTGAFFMFPRKLGEKLNGLDEDYFMYVEEMDFCYRVKELGLDVCYLQEPYVFHIGRGSGTSEFAIVSEFKNVLLFYKKHLPQQAFFARACLKLGGSLRRFIFAILGNSQRAQIYEKATASI